MVVGEAAGGASPSYRYLRHKISVPKVCQALQHDPCQRAVNIGRGFVRALGQRLAGRWQLFRNRCQMNFHSVDLQTPDLDSLEVFYGHTLGLPVVRREGLEVQVGSTCLRWKLGASSPYHLAFNLPENHLVEARKFLQSRVPMIPLGNGQPFAEFTSWRARSFYFLDPAGNILECIVRSDLRCQSRLPFGASSWLCVSEVGLVVDDVLATAASLVEKLGIAYFDGQGNPGFCALGDDRGLLILVANGRVWYPTIDLRAAPSPLNLEWEGQRLSFPPVEVQRAWRPGDMVSLNGQLGVVTTCPDVPEDHQAVWFGPEPEVWTIPSDLLQSAPAPRMKH